MAQLSDDCFAFGGVLMAGTAALERIRTLPLSTPSHTTVALAEAPGRILAAAIVAPRDVPPHDNAAVDGYAVYLDDLSPDAPTLLPIEGRAAAGHPLEKSARRGAAVRIFTGAPMPAGPDTVLMQEDCRESDGRVSLPPGIKRGANRRRAGEDMRVGDTVLRPGHRLRPPDIGLVASLGLTEVPVFAPLRVTLASTGDEVRDPGVALPPGGIYDANRYMLAALLRGLGCKVSDLGILPDDAAIVRDALGNAARDHDLVITSGGVSTGVEDHVKAAVEAQGRLHFWRLAIKPGRPVAMGQIGGTPFVGLPGNPVAVMVTFLLLARPLILRLAGATELAPRAYRVTAGFAYGKKAGRCEYLRARLVRGNDGGWVAEKFARDGAGILTSITESDGLVVLGEEVTKLAEGEPVDFLPFAEFAA